MKFEDKGYEAYGQGNLQLALEEWTVEADAGNPFAQFSLGMMYENGTGIPPNISHHLCRDILPRFRLRLHHRRRRLGPK